MAGAEMTIRVLLVEDDDDDRLLTSGLLADARRSRFVVQWVRTLGAAAEELDRHAHDVCLLDYRLGAARGLELLDQARARRWRVPFILLTGESADAVDVEAMSAGAADYLEKGLLDSSTLERTIRYSIAQANALRAAEDLAQELRELVHEKELLIKEVHHRVKNNLQVVTSLLRLQARTIEDPAAREAFRVCQDRVAAIARVHERLYHSSNVARIDLHTYAAQLVREVSCAYVVHPDAISITTELDPIALRLDDAVPWALILNELVTNALKHGFPDGRRGQIRIACRDVGDGRIELTVADDGVGLPAHKAAPQLPLVAMLARQLGGSVETDSAVGFRVKVTVNVMRQLS
jgi:two-component sensor histidine kinase